MQTASILRDILSSQFIGSSTVDVSKKNFEALASYNWVNETKPTIFVPGSPPRWTPQPSGTEIPKDSGLHIIDQNSYRNPTYPLEPLFRALFTQHPTFNPSAIDLFTDRSNLRKLLRFVNGESQRPFQIGVQHTGKTTLFTRMEEASSEYITEFRGYGLGFEELYTTFPAGLERSTGHNRIIRYDFGGLRCVVRFELDAFDLGGAGGLPHGTPSTSHSNTNVCKSSTFDVIKRGSLVPQSSLVEIKTRAQSRVLDWKEVLPQLWFSATPSLTVAYHRYGRFDDIRTTRMDAVGGQLEVWERRNAGGLGKVVELIRIIVQEAEGVEGGCVLVQGNGGGGLTILKAPPKDSLPEDLKLKMASSTQGRFQ